MAVPQGLLNNEGGTKGMRTVKLQMGERVARVVKRILEDSQALEVDEKTKAALSYVSSQIGEALKGRERHG
jgi:hypothetical protein